MKMLLFLPFSFLAMISQVKSDPFAYNLLAELYDTKAKEIDTSINWADRIQEVLLIPTNKIWEDLGKTNLNWQDQLTKAVIYADNLKQNSGESSSKNSGNIKIDSICNNHRRINTALGCMMPLLLEPTFNRITHFKHAYDALQKKPFDKEFLDAVKGKLPILKETHDNLLAKVRTNVNNVFIPLRDEYIQKLNSRQTVSGIKTAQEKFLYSIENLVLDLKKFATGAIKNAKFLLQTKKHLKLTELSDREASKLEAKFEEELKKK